MGIQITWTNTTTGLNESFTWLDDAAMTRILAWAKLAYPTIAPNGTATAPNDTQACRRASRAFILRIRDAARTMEKDIAVAAVADPAPIDVTV